MINSELISTARLLVAAVQDANDFSAEYLKKVIVHLVPQLLGEIEILGVLAKGALDQPGGVDAARALLEQRAAAAAPAPAKKKSKAKGRGRRRK